MCVYVKTAVILLNQSAVIPHLSDILLIVVLIVILLGLLGWCHFCAHLHRFFWRCPGCGLSRPYEVAECYRESGAYTVQRMVIVERCDACKDSTMILIVRKWTWWLSRPFAWIWIPLVLIHGGIIELVKLWKKPTNG